ncbi:MAG: hypothetical protein QXX68_01910 [Candidatus Pacearchaeota archaeon]
MGENLPMYNSGEKGLYQEGLIKHLKEQNRYLRKTIRSILEKIVGKEINSNEDIELSMSCFFSYWPDIHRIREEYSKGYNSPKTADEEQIDFF